MSTNPLYLCAMSTNAFNRLNKSFEMQPSFQIYVDVIAQHAPGQVVLIDRGVAPFGWALPGGLADPGEIPAMAACREAREETSLQVDLSSLFNCYPFVNEQGICDAVTFVYLAKSSGTPYAQDDAKDAKVFSIDSLPTLIPSHKIILRDYRHWLSCGKLPEAESNLPSHSVQANHLKLLRAS